MTVSAAAKPVPPLRLLGALVALGLLGLLGWHWLTLQPLTPSPASTLSTPPVLSWFRAGLTLGLLAGAGLATLLLRRAGLQGRAGCREREDFRLLQTVLNTLPAPIFFKDETGVYLGCNQAFERFLGCGRENIVGRTVYDVAPRDLADIYHKADLALFRQGGTQSYETSVVHADGSRHHVLFHKAVFSKPDGSPGGLVGTMLDITESKEAQEKARYLAHFDPLTELPNQVLFTDRLSLAIAHANRLDLRFAVFCLDLDHFKKINNAFGHPLGNKLLRRVGERLCACLREDDTVARMGGDSFNLLVPNIGSVEGATKVVQKVLDSLRTPFEVDDREIYLSASIGIALFPYDGDDAATLVKNADIALQRAKEKGRGGHQFFDAGMNMRAEEQMVMEGHLRRALERDEFVLYYQPQVDARTGRLIGFEALVRWRHPELGIIQPDRFIPLAEQTGLIGPIGEWVLREACRQSRDWRDNGFEPLRMAVNLSPRQFQHPDLFRKIDLILRESGLDPAGLSLEVTESTVMHNVDHAIETLVRLKNLGVHLAVDDFGTGYSSLSYLKRFPIDLLKIDRSFIMDLPAYEDDAAIVTAVIAMAHKLEIKVLAEGVQNEMQKTFLQAHHCDELQGYLFGPPLPPGEIFAETDRTAAALA
jgi:diguanylate cyclase (GGDEF)-like protein/PAS domain S-box-containing protein